jgi:pyrroline-5-carboxylate reductase
MTASTPRLLLIGGGRMGEALLTGLLANGWAELAEVTVVEPSTARQAELRQTFPDLTIATEPVAADGAVLAVKPAQVASAARALGSAGGAAHVLSIAAGITTAAIEAELPAGTPVVRAMPNTPSLVGAGAAAIAGGAAAGDDDLAWAETLLATVGTVVRVSEPALDLVTGLSGSGPAYVFLVAEALIDAGVLVGLPRDTATALAVQTLLGSARLLAESGDDAATLRANVTSPGGTTAAGLRELEQAGVRAAFLDAVTAAVERARELGRS